jgi:hypothetical protein
MAQKPPLGPFKSCLDAYVCKECGCKVDSKNRKRHWENIHPDRLVDRDGKPWKKGAPGPSRWGPGLTNLDKYWYPTTPGTLPPNIVKPWCLNLAAYLWRGAEAERPLTADGRRRHARAAVVTRLPAADPEPVHTAALELHLLTSQKRYWRSQAATVEAVVGSEAMNAWETDWLRGFCGKHCPHALEAVGCHLAVAAGIGRQHDVDGLFATCPLVDHVEMNPNYIDLLRSRIKTGHLPPGVVYADAIQDHAVDQA